MKQNKKNQKCFSKVDPDYLKKVADMLQHDIKAEKDTANYNSLVISNFIDKASISLRDSGQKEIQPGDVFRILEEIDAMIQNRKSEPHVFNIDNPNNVDVDYKVFDHKLELEQRTKHILRTEALDTFDSLMDELDIYMPRFISMEQWGRIKTAISKGNERISKNNLIFIGPETFVGKEMKMSTKEMERLGFSLEQGNITYDLRPDGPDLLAMKELVRVLKGEPMEDLSFAPGFFAKYTHELIEEKIGCVIFHSVDKKLKSLEFFIFDHPRFKEELEDQPIENQRFTPAQAVALFSRILYDRTKKLDEKLLINSFKSNERFHFVFHGFVSTPKDNSHFGYEEDPKLNEELVRSGEVFLIKKKEKDDSTSEPIVIDGVGQTKNVDRFTTTRIYFVPENYQYFHPYHQHGSVIFGNNDYSYHSAALFIEYAQTRNWFLKRYPEKVSLYQPSFVFCSAIKYKGIPNEKMEEILHGNRWEDFTAAFFNHYEENYFIFHRILERKLIRFKVNRALDKEMSDEEFDELEKYKEFFYKFALEHLVFNRCTPLHKIWTLRQYLKDGTGIGVRRIKGLMDKVTDATLTRNGMDAMNFVKDKYLPKK